jgi:hypothetical protein
VDELELTQIQRLICDHISNSTGAGKHSAKSAVAHITRAWKIRNIDPEMSLFRAITGEDESVTAMFHALKRIGYRNANKLDPQNRAHKGTVQPFISAVEEKFQPFQIGELLPQILFNTDEKPPRLRTRITRTTPGGEKVSVYPLSSLELAVQRDGRVFDFSEELSQIVDDNTIDDVVNEIADNENLRNMLMHGSLSGVPGIETLVERFLKNKQERIFRNLILFLLIDFSPQQPFVQHTVNSFLELVRQVVDNRSMLGDA